MLSTIPSIPPQLTVPGEFALSEREEAALPSERLRSLLLTRIPEETRVLNLLRVALEATRLPKPYYVQSIFGPARNWIPPHDDYSEFSAINLWEPLQTLELLWKLTIPAYDHKPDKWVRTFFPPIVRNTFWRPCSYVHHPDPWGLITSHRSERWFFINGICTNLPMARQNMGLMARMFQRPSTLVHNASGSLLWDLVQCALGKSFHTDPDLSQRQTMSTPSYMAASAILAALQDEHVDRVIVLAHSQGTIIAANVLRAIQRALRVLHQLGQRPSAEEARSLGPLTEKACNAMAPDAGRRLPEAQLERHFIRLMQKLEFYLFSNCADRMTYALVTKDRHGHSVGLPYMENFANENDLVARLGILSPLRNSVEELIDLDGDTYVRRGPGSWGHLLNEHHLFAIEDHLSHPQRSTNPYQPLDDTHAGLPRLYRYFAGQRPAPYFAGNA